MQLPTLSRLPICTVCGKPLKTPKSVERGRGPQCQRRYEAAEFAKQADLELNNDDINHDKQSR